MRKVKYRLEDFLMFDYLAVERHLGNMARKGWKLESIGVHLWKYRRIEPSELTFAVTYIEDASDFNPGPTESQMLLEEYCETAGWEKVCDWNKMQIFCTEEKNPVPLESEESVRLEVIQKSMDKSFVIPNLIVMCYMVILSLFLAHLVVGTDMNGMRVINSIALCGLLMCILGTVVEAGAIGNYFRWISRSEKSIAQGGACVENRFYRIFSKITWGIIFILFVAMMLAYLEIEDVGRRVYQYLYLPMLWLIIFLVGRVRQGLKKLGVSKAINIVLTLAADFLIAFLLIGGMSYLLLF